MAKQSTRSAILVLRVRPELKAALERLATNERRSISNYIAAVPGNPDVCYRQRRLEFI